MSKHGLANNFSYGGFEDTDHYYDGWFVVDYQTR
jgi:hypothetical protein